MKLHGETEFKGQKSVRVRCSDFIILLHVAQPLI